MKRLSKLFVMSGSALILPSSHTVQHLASPLLNWVSPRRLYL